MQEQNRKQKVPPRISGDMWVDTVADYLLGLYPTMLEDGVTGNDVYNLFLRGLDDDSWY